MRGSFVIFRPLADRPRPVPSQEWAGGPFGADPRKLAGVLFEGSQLGAMQCAIHRRGPARIHFIQALGDCIPLLPVQKLRHSRDVQSTAGNAEAAAAASARRKSSPGSEACSFHGFGIAGVTPDSVHPTVLGRVAGLSETCRRWPGATPGTRPERASRAPDPAYFSRNRASALINRGVALRSCGRRPRRT